MIPVSTVPERIRATIVGYPTKRVAFAYLLLACLTAPSVSGRAKIAGMQAGNEEAVQWVRLDNPDLRMDFSRENSDVPEDVILRSRNMNLSGFVGDEAYFWRDLLNGLPIVDASATVKKNRQRGSDSNSLLIAGYSQAESGPGLVLDKEIQLVPDGAQMEVRFRLTNTDVAEAPATYSLMTPWVPGGSGESVRYHVPKSPGVLRFVGDADDSPVVVEGVEIAEPWFCADSPDEGIAVFLVSSLPIVRWSADSPVAGQRNVETVLWEGLLKPGESVEGVYWVAVVEGIGLPVAAGSQYVVGLEWEPMPSGSSYRLETRVTGMPRALKKFRFFSAIGDSASALAFVPKYTRRSRLSRTEVVRVALPGCYTEGVYNLEQSIYASSNSVGYWKTRVRTPGSLAKAAAGVARPISIPYTDPVFAQAATPRPITPSPYQEAVMEDSLTDLHDLVTAWVWSEDHDSDDPAYSEWSELLALQGDEIEWVFVDEEE